MKGWIDRVLREEVAYTFPKGDNGGGVPIGLLKAKAALVFNTSNTPGERERDIFGDPLEHIWKDCVFGFCGVHVFERKMFRIIADSTPELRRKMAGRSKGNRGGIFPCTIKKLPSPAGDAWKKPQTHFPLLPQAKTSRAGRNKEKKTIMPALRTLPGPQGNPRRRNTSLPQHPDTIVFSESPD